ncbi:MAG: cobalamin-dependent protein [Candidatus Woesearchaeota archaeon]
MEVGLLTTQDNDIALGLANLASWYQKYSKYATHISFSIVEVARVLNRPVDSPKLITKRLLSYDIVAVSTVTQDFNLVIEICALLKALKPCIRIVLGGHHISSIPESMPTTADVLVLGKGEETFQKLLDAFVENHDWEVESLSKIDGIAYYQRQKLVRTKKRFFIKDIDQIPLLAYQLFDKRHWYPVFAKGFKVFGSVSTSRAALTIVYSAILQGFGETQSGFIAQHAWLTISNCCTGSTVVSLLWSRMI